MEGTQGWMCGLGQILDIQQKHILEILPYILTAYLYNFCEEPQKGTRKWERTDFVKKFYRKQIEKLKGFEIKEPDKTNRFLFGFTDAPETFFYEAGIGKLLQGTFDTSSSKGTHRLNYFQNALFFLKRYAFLNME